jgi:succinate-acetate transporter protein
LVPDSHQDRGAASACRRMSGTSAETAAKEELAGRTRIVLRPIASPFAIGFFGLAAATFVMAGLQLGWAPAAEGQQVALCLLAFTVPLQFTASILAFLARDGIAATGMGLLSGIWAATGVVLLTASPGSTSTTLGLFLIITGIAMWAPASAAAASKLVPSLVLATAGLRFLLTGVYQLTSSEIWENIAGIVGLILAALATYAAYAAEYEDALKKPVLPLGRRGRGEQALEGTYAQQVAALSHDPGIRQQL